jgi:hypothetical protein
MPHLLRTSRALSYLVAAAAGALLAGGGWAIAASSSGVIRACSGKKGGALRIATKCKKSERSVSWNQQGLRGLQGPVGATGAQGPAGSAGAAGLQGATGPSHGYSTSFNTEVTLEAAGSVHTLMTLSVPSGSYIVVTRLQGMTGTDGGGNNFRYDCTLAGAEGVIDNPIYRVGETNSVENYLTYQGGYTGAGPITLACRSGNGHTLKAITGSIVATKVGGLN